MPNQYRIIHDAVAILETSEALPQAARNLLSSALPYGAGRATAVEAAIGLALQAPHGLSAGECQTLLVAQIAARHYRPAQADKQAATPGTGAPAQQQSASRAGEERA